MMEHLLSLPKGTEVEVRAPVYKIHGEDYDYLFEQIRVNGYRRARIDGKPRDLGEHIKLDEDQPHSVEAVIDTFVVGPGIDQQVVTSLEHGLKLGDGLLGFHIVKPRQPGAEHKKFYDGFGCAQHRIVAGQLQASEFTFNDPAGACPTCAGIGMAMRVHPSLLVPDPKRTLNQGAFVNAALGNSPDSWGGACSTASPPITASTSIRRSRTWPKSTCKSCSTAPRGSCLRSCCPPRLKSDNSMPARRSSSRVS